MRAELESRLSAISSRLLSSLCSSPSAIEESTGGSETDIFRHRGKLLGLMFGHQRVAQFADVAVHDVVHLVQGEVDAVVGDAALREIIGANALAAVDRADLAGPVRRSVGLRLLLGQRQRPRACCCSPTLGDCPALVTSAKRGTCTCERGAPASRTAAHGARCTPGRSKWPVDLHRRIQ